MECVCVHVSLCTCTHTICVWVCVWVNRHASHVIICSLLLALQLCQGVVRENKRLQSEVFLKFFFLKIINASEKGRTVEQTEGSKVGRKNEWMERRRGQNGQITPPPPPHPPVLTSCATWWPRHAGPTAKHNVWLTPSFPYSSALLPRATIQEQVILLP